MGRHIMVVQARWTMLVPSHPRHPSHSALSQGFAVLRLCFLGLSVASLIRVLLSLLQAQHFCGGRSTLLNTPDFVNWVLMLLGRGDRGSSAAIFAPQSC